MNNNDDEEKKPKKSMTEMATSVINFIKKIPAWAWPIIGYVAAGIGGVLLLLMVILAPTFIADSVKEEAGHWFEKLGNLFTFQGYNSNEEVAAKMEKKFYKELNDQKKKYKNKYGIYLNTTLITATLFYNRDFGNYTSDNGCTKQEYDAGFCDNGNSDLQVLDKDFYKKAKGHIKTLAKYMTIDIIEKNSCAKSNPGRVEAPKTAQEIAEASSGWENNSAFASTKTVTNKVLYSHEFPYCPYEDISGYYLSEYKKDKDLIVKAADNVNKVCDEGPFNPAQQQRCQIAEKQYEKQLKSYDKWVAGGFVTDTDPSSNKSQISFNCPYLPKQVADPTHSVVNVQYDGCSELPNYIERHAIDDRRGGVYYYKLMTKFRNMGFESEDSFISKYYAAYVKADDEETLNKNVLDVVNGIFDLYETIKDSAGSFSAPGDYASWSQKDSKWGNVPIGFSNIYNIGCAATSVAILLARSGAQVNLNGELNPGTFVEAMSANGGFSGELINWGAVNNFAPTFFYIESGTSLSVDYLTDLLAKGYYVTVRVLPSPEQHWVAIEKVENGIVYMNDPAFIKGENHPATEELFSGGWGTPYGMYDYRVYENRS